jgi:hypothetical protein
MDDHHANQTLRAPAGDAAARSGADPHGPAYGYPTVRRYPRTLGDAYPCERWPVIEHYSRPSLDRWAGVVLAVCLAVSIAFGLAVYLGS